MKTGKEALTIANGEFRIAERATRPFRRNGIREKVPSKFRPRLPALPGRRHVQRRRRGIFVESQPKHDLSPVGAAYSGDVAPDGA